jgi:hypothetical protein
VNIPATTYDLSANGISIDIETALIPQEDASIILEINSKQIKARVRFVRKEQISGGYRLSFFVLPQRRHSFYSYGMPHHVCQRFT